MADKEAVLASLNIKAMYPSITFNVVRRAVSYFAKSLSKSDKRTISVCLDLIKFGMNNTLLTFVDKYYEYGETTDPEEKALTIGGYESAWLADLVAAYILCNLEDLFTGTSDFFGMVQ